MSERYTTPTSARLLPTANDEQAQVALWRGELFLRVYRQFHISFLLVFPPLGTRQHNAVDNLGLGDGDY